MKIVVLAGGISAERDVSLSSGAKVCEALKKSGHEAVLLDVFLGYKSDDISDVFQKNIEGLFEIHKSAPDIGSIKAKRGGGPLFGENVLEICKLADIVFMALHGEDGENGKLQAAFDLLDVKYTGSGHLGSALAMNKEIAKEIFVENGIICAKGIVVEKGREEEEIGFPCVVKPCSGGSSIGVSIAYNADEYSTALQSAFQYERCVMVEKYIQGREFSVGILAGKALPIIEIIPSSSFYDYANKYQGKTLEVCPAELDSDTALKMQKTALEAFHALKLEVYARVDFILGEDAFYCLEANTLPGLTPMSLLPQEAAAVGIEYGRLCERIIEESLKKYKENP